MIEHNLEFTLQNKLLASYFRYWKLHSLIDKIQDLKIAQNEGCGILGAMYNLVLSHNVTQILSTLPKLLELQHKNQETMAEFLS